MSRNLRAIHTTVTDSLDSLVKAYSIAAAAAGVSVLATATPAVGKIVITNANIPVPACAYTSPCPVYVDLNKDGINDFELQLDETNSGAPPYFVRQLKVNGVIAGDKVMAKGQGFFPYYSASCLVKGAKIGPSAQFKASALIERSFVYGQQSTTVSQVLYGKWGGNHANRFLGVKFKIKGATHYGWIRVKVDTSLPKNLSATITEYGYETIANKTVSAGLSGTEAENIGAEKASPQPKGAALGMLAAGADGLELWRREETLPF